MGDAARFASPFLVFQCTTLTIVNGTLNGTPNSLYYNILYIVFQCSSKKGTIDIFGRIPIYCNVEITIIYSIPNISVRKTCFCWNTGTPHLNSSFSTRYVYHFDVPPKTRSGTPRFFEVKCL